MNKIDLLRKYIEKQGMRCNYTFDKKKSSLQLVVDQQDSSGPAYDINVFSDPQANTAWGLFEMPNEKCSR